MPTKFADMKEEEMEYGGAARTAMVFGSIFTGLGVVFLASAACLCVVCISNDMDTKTTLEFTLTFGMVGALLLATGISCIAMGRKPPKPVRARVLNPPPVYHPMDLNDNFVPR